MPPPSIAPVTVVCPPLPPAHARQVLKCIHQEIIFPAVCALRFSIYTVLPYKDVKGEWRVRVEVRALPIASQSHRARGPLTFPLRGTLLGMSAHPSPWHPTVTVVHPSAPFPPSFQI